VHCASNHCSKAVTAGRDFAAGSTMSRYARADAMPASAWSRHVSLLVRLALAKPCAWQPPT
jgi:hypothetical protein